MTGSDSSMLRPAVFEDGQQASELVRSLGLTMPKTPESIDNHWRRLWIDNPAMTGGGTKPPLGWVLEKNERMVGFFCNVPLLYYLGNRRVTVSVASQWGLDKSHRTKIHQLAGAYFGQDHTDILLATTANKSAGRIFQYYGANQIPQPDSDHALFWIIDGRGFIGGAMKSKGISPVISSVLSATAAPLFRAARTMGWRRPKGCEEKVDLIRIEEVDEAFDGLWQRKRDETERLLACRTADCLRWHFGDTSRDKEARVLAHRQGQLRGYAVVVHEHVANIGLKHLRIADLFVENNDRAVVNDLLCAAYQYARDQGCHVLEWIGIPTNLRGIALEHNPFVRALPTWPLFYKAVHNELAGKLERPAAWYITSYDGDTTLA